MVNQIVEQADNKSASKIGKFNTADDLLAAYNALEGEFTKRCQLVKQLQAELDSLRAQAQADDTVCDGGVRSDGAAPEPERDTAADGAQPSQDDRPVPEAGGDSNGEVTTTAVIPAPSIVTADDVLNEILQNACEYAEALSAIPEVMNACIASYKQRLIRPQPASAPSGCAVIVPAKRPTTLSEAKRLADALLAGN
ncbi:MAG: hypothetical protein K2F90_02915 [Clostridiales bacterium]|nr:hypothetical protein [Clostridiales bacterium]